jgi:hypothetical protein
MRRILEAEGAAKVRLKLMTNGLNQSYVPVAVEWLAELEDAERSRKEASQASQVATDLSTNRAAWIAAKAAIVAATIAIAAIIVSILLWLFPRH